MKVIHTGCRTLLVLHLYSTSHSI